MALEQGKSSKEQGDYKFTVDRVSKEFQIEFDGKFSDQEGGEQFVKEFTHKVNSVNANEYTLVIDIEKLVIFEQGAIEQITDIFAFYGSCNFKTIKFVLGDGPVINKMQIGRIARNAKLTSYEFV